MRLNRRMRAHLADLRSRQIEATPTLPARGLFGVEVLQAGECFLLRRFLSRPPASSLAELPDHTALECTANRLHMSEIVNPKLVRSAPLLLLTAGLLVAEELSRQLAGFADRFNVIVSYDGDSCAVRFHKIRPGERWLAADLEEYAEEGVLVFEAGAQSETKSERLLRG